MQLCSQVENVSLNLHNMTNSKLKNKTILLIAPKFFGYEIDIQNELENCGASVFFLQENIDSLSLREKVINQLPLAIRNNVRQRYFIHKIDELIPPKNSVDYVLGIRMDLFDNVILTHLRNRFKKAKFLCYFWDSSKNMRNANLVASFFDKVFTFDREDSLKYDGWIFRPLFYNDLYKNCKSSSETTIDILFIGSLMPRRAELYMWLYDFCRKRNFSLFTYFYCKFYVFLFNIFKQNTYKKIPFSIVHNCGLGKQDIIKKFESCRVVFDCCSPSQSGLTIRTIECLGAQKKLITTNAEIVKYDFFNSHNIFLFDVNQQQEMEKFIKESDYEQLNKEIYDYYSIHGWINSIFE